MLGALPNITGNPTVAVYDNASQNVLDALKTGAFYKDTTKGDGNGWGYTNNSRVMFSAQKSNALYKASTVTVPSLKTLFLIKI